MVTGFVYASQDGGSGGGEGECTEHTMVSVYVYCDSMRGMG